MGESFGAWKMGNDAEMLDYVSSANIACGFHAGDAGTMRRTTELALEKNVAVGAHPSYPDLQGFGRREMKMSPEEVGDIILYQSAALKGICEALGGKLHHVKPHGALYNQSAADPALARVIAEAVKALDPDLILYGLAGSHSIKEAERAGLRTASEVFSDRTYRPDGSLTPRTEKNALIHDPQKGVAQIFEMIVHGKATAADGTEFPIRAETVCIHGDGEKAVDFARALRGELENAGVRIESVAG